MHSLIKDIQYGLRNLLKRPSYTAIALLTLALGIGANTAIFSLVSAVLLRPLPVPHPEQLVEVYGTMHSGADVTIQSYLNYKDYRDRTQTLSGLMAYRFVPVSISQESRNERAWGYLVSGNYFDVLGVQPFLGRYFQPEEDKAPGANPVAVISYGGIGLVAALGVTQLLTKILFGVSAFDPPTFVAVCALLAAVAALSSYLPARRATKVDPLVALRYE
jgi:putative ABC transport system permease protein